MSTEAGWKRWTSCIPYFGGICKTSNNQQAPTSSTSSISNVRFLLVFGSTGSAAESHSSSTDWRLPSASHGSHHRWREKTRGWTWSVQRPQTILHTKMCSNLKVEVATTCSSLPNESQIPVKIPRIWTSWVCLQTSWFFRKCASHSLMMWQSLRQEYRARESIYISALVNQEAEMNRLRRWLFGRRVSDVFSLSVVWLRCIKWIIKWYNSDITVICDTIV